MSVTTIYLTCPHCRHLLGKADEGNPFGIGRPFRICSRCQKCVRLPFETSEWELLVHEKWKRQIEDFEQKIKQIPEPGFRLGEGALREWLFLFVFIGLFFSLPAGFISYVALFEISKDIRSAHMGDKYITSQIQTLFTLGRAVMPDIVRDANVIPLMVTLAVFVLAPLSFFVCCWYAEGCPTVVRELDWILRVIDASRTDMSDPDYRQQLRDLGLKVRDPNDQREPACVMESVARLQQLKLQAEEKYAALSWKKRTPTVPKVA